MTKYLCALHFLHALACTYTQFRTIVPKSHSVLATVLHLTVRESVQGLMRDPYSECLSYTLWDFRCVPIDFRLVLTPLD